MANTEMIMKRIRELGFKQSDLAKELGLKQSSLSLKINNKRPFFLVEAVKLAQLLEIHDDEFRIYFFADDVA